MKPQKNNEKPLEYKGIVVEFFTLKKKKHKVGSEFKTTDKKMFNHLLTLKRITNANS